MEASAYEKMKRTELTSCVALIGCALISQAQAEYVTSPTSPTPNHQSVGAFLVTSVEASSVRFQQVHDASDFVSAAGPVLLITELSYSAPTWTPRVPIDVTLPNIQIRMSTTMKAPDTLSRNFTENVGPDQVVVYSGPLHFYETGLESYDIHVSITPFRYDPTIGNLLVEVFNYAPILTRRDPDWALETTDQFLDSVSGLGGRATDSSGFAGTAGLTTRFTYTPVPEPATWALFAIGLVALSTLGWKRQRAKR